jgi:hypothetical protein
MTDHFAEIEQRRLALRLTENDLLDHAGVDKVRWWRARKGIHKRPDTTLRVVQQVERALDRLEAAPCALCGLKVTKPCDQFGCPITKDEA